MTPEHAGLLARIESFDIDGGEAGFPFAARLARENGWSRDHAERVVAEYRRFVFLAVISDTPVCPSEDVDAAWHLHLTYTRSYWKRFCGEVLGRPLHHEPTRGGPAEHEKHLEMYARTLARYRAAFGRAAPPEIWPAAAERFGDHLRHRVVNTARNWVIPKAPVRRAAGLAVLFAAVAVFVPGCEGGLNPFALEGSDFLGFLIPAMVAAVCLGRVIASRQRGPEPEDPREGTGLSWDQAAYLAGGPARLTTAAVARLVGCGAAKLAGDRLVPGDHPLPDRASPAEPVVLAALPVANSTAALGPVAKAVDAAYADEARRLEDAGYLMSAAANGRAWVLSIVPLLVVLLGFALPRFATGVARNKPTEYLVAAVALGSVVGLGVVSAGVTRLTRRGERALEALRDGNPSLRSGETWEGTGDAALAVALFGTVALAGSGIAYLQSWYPRQASASWGGCGTAGCGTGGCGGGAGGCGGGGGGCGGGGCGGCGGGD